MGPRRMLAALTGLVLGMLLVTPVRGAQVSGRIIATRGVSGRVAACASCHQVSGGGGGNGIFPRLAGLPAVYIRMQLLEFRTRRRSSEVMQGVAARLNNREINAVAAYYSAQVAPYPPAPQVRSKALLVGERLVAIGDYVHGVPACQACHGPTLLGGGPQIPRLGGQWYSYLVKQMQAFHEGLRSSGPLHLMGNIARKMTAAEMRDAALYIASLRPHRRVGIPRGNGSNWKAAPQSPDHFSPPPESTLPTGGRYGAMILLGENIFTDTPRYAGNYVGNRLSCSNCHLDRGRSPTAAPMWAAVPTFPKYRRKNDRVNTLQMRIQGCFRYSENGRAPPPDGRALVALTTYMHWLATGLPIGVKPKASGYPKMAEPADGFDRERGRNVYASHCALCHGEEGQGRIAGGEQVFPALWGPQSFNWGAGMHRVNTAAAFIKYNMPFSDGGSLSNQQAWDVAAWVDSQPRPQDPRFKGDVAVTAQRFHKHEKFDYYGKKIDGHRLGAPSTLKAWERRHKIAVTQD